MLRFFFQRYWLLTFFSFKYKLTAAISFSSSCLYLLSLLSGISYPFIVSNITILIVIIPRWLVKKHLTICTRTTNKNACYDTKRLQIMKRGQINFNTMMMLKSEHFIMEMMEYISGFNFRMLSCIQIAKSQKMLKKSMFKWFPV